MYNYCVLIIFKRVSCKHWSDVSYLTDHGWAYKIITNMLTSLSK